jgi:predicted transport protein
LTGLCIRAELGWYNVEAVGVNRRHGMALFRIQNGSTTSVNPVEFESEASLQKLVDRNLESMTGVRKLESQYRIPNGKIDTLGIDERNVPVVIEYKWGRDPGAIVQALFYLDWLRQNKRTLEMLVREKLGSEVEVNWKASTRVIVIAKDFDIKELSAVNQMEPIVELKRYNYYGDLLTIEDATPTRVSTQSAKASEDATEEEYTLESVLEPALPATQEVFWKLRDRILLLGEGIREVLGDWYVDYRKSSTFVSVNIQKKGLVVFIKMGEKKVDDPKRITTPITYYGRLNTRFRVDSVVDLDYAMKLVKQAYDYVP